jgi:hypothetical protein
MTDHEKVFSYDTTLLAARQYREWFWSGFSKEALSFLRAKPRKINPPAADNHLVNWQSTMPKNWSENSACKGADSLVFFSSSTYPKREYMKPDAKWRQYCPQCPVRESCLQAARDSESVGIWGGRLFVRDKGGSRVISEYDETTMPKQGRPRKA